MKNIMKLLKYNLTYDKKTYNLIGIAFILLVLLAWLPAATIIVSTAFTIWYFVASVTNFIKCISKQEGRLLFQSPIKGWEFMCAKYLEYLIVTIVVMILFIIVSLLGSIILIDTYGVILIAMMAIVVTFESYVVITSSVVIANCYFTKRWKAIVATVITLGIFNIISKFIVTIIQSVTPLIYISIMGMKFDLIIVILQLIVSISIFTIVIKHFDKKLEIN